jgi:hypothetical protein
MTENQNIEYKKSWHNEYLKWICGFANSIGGVLYIGIDDSGHVVHLNDYARLMEEIPNKIRNTMGIQVELFKEKQVTPQVTPQVEKLLFLLTKEMGRTELQNKLGLSDRENFRINYILPALEAKLVEMTHPDKPKSSHQKYRLTDMGKQFVRNNYTNRK